MSLDELENSLKRDHGQAIEKLEQYRGELTVEVRKDACHDLCHDLRVTHGFDVLIDVCGVDYLTYGVADWKTDQAPNTGFSRAVEVGCDNEHASVMGGMGTDADTKRLAVVYHLLSTEHNQRLRVRAFVGGEPPMIASVADIWSGANWFEREAFDLFGILFDGHPDLRRLLTDYGFIGHPFRKDFPVSGHVEVRYDATQARVVYEPVELEPRVLVPKVIRHDGRYNDQGLAKEEEVDG